MAQVLIIDDDASIRELLTSAVEDIGHSASSVPTLAEATRVMSQMQPDAIYLDIRLPDGDGLALLDVLDGVEDRPEVIIITGRGDPDGAALAISKGAWDYIEKPCSLERLTLPLLRALDFRQHKHAHSGPHLLHREEVVGSSQAIRNCLSKVAKVATAKTDVLLTGETGTGKELFAKTIHENSAVCDGPFTVVDCASLPKTLAESLLFGHEQGAFTGAQKTTVGLVREADGGTLFIDEIGELDMELQTRFLRVLQERQVRPVGSDRSYSCNFRLLAATNRELRAMVEAGTFREDLYYRIKSIVIELPPLRKRKDDIKDLVQHYINITGGRMGGGIKAVSPEYIQALWSHDWPGNVRELFQVLEASLVISQDSPTVHPVHLPRELRAELVRKAVAPGQGGGAPGRNMPTWKAFRERALADAAGRYFAELIKLSEGDRGQACSIAGLKQARLYQLLRKYHRPTQDDGQRLLPAWFRS